eukprot:CAMPEP_0177598194 /NCGR_PEP_ID=MMETSP0419_2-20121207/12187_1 /TAXON_ID=582737 /ORGANISM="Tetraselmis sp., Strain GSL018" /LENGTH=714 /DNA_ID=CAMNT_0019090559 /DNA_START=138 /DNA_END=2283 /DNA_ORIENTATION=+
MVSNKLPQQQGNFETVNTSLAAAAEALKNPPYQSLYNPKHFEVEDDRTERLHACKVVDTPPETRFDHITRLMAEVFKTPVCLITLIIDDRVWFKSKVGPFGACVCRDGSWCNYIVVPTAPEVLITEDASVDARFAHNPYVAGDPHIKFYAGAPLVGTGGRRYGTLCVVDLVPRAFTAEMYHLLINFAELAVQELERDSDLLTQWSEQALSDYKNNKRLRMQLSTATEGVSLLDIRSPSWTFKYANAAFARHGGEAVEEFVGRGFWDKFEPEGMTQLEVAEKIAEGGVAEVPVTCKTTGKRFSLTLRPACSDQMTPGKPVTVPSWVPSEKSPGGVKMGIDMEPVEVAKRDPALCQDVEKCFYLGIVSPARCSADGGSPTGSASSEEARSPLRPLGSPRAYGDYGMPRELEGLEMGPLVGSGGFGKVYRGLRDGEVVAVKIVETQSEAKATQAKAEGMLGMSLDHPNVVKTLCVAAGEGEQQYLLKGMKSKSEKVSIMWIVSEYCDRGMLIDAVERGWLSQARTIFSKPNMLNLYLTALDVAKGMLYLHRRNLIHCDLNGRNVMLQHCESDPRGFVAKVCDFGLTQICEGDNISTDAFGTISHMSPELLMDGRLGFKADIWAFGVLLWEMYTGYRAYQGRKPGNIIFLVTSGKGKLELPEDAPEAYKELTTRCLNFEPEKGRVLKALWNTSRQSLKSMDIDTRDTIHSCPKSLQEG